MRGVFLAVALAAAANANSALTASGRAAFERGDVERAIAELEKAVAADPKDSDAHSLLGEAYGRKAEKTGLFGGISLAKKAKAEFVRAVELSPDSAESRLRLIEYYVRAPGIAGGSEKKALEQAAEVRKRDALNGYRAYALIDTLQKRFGLAVRETARAVAELPASAGAHCLHGSALLDLKDWASSLREYETALSLDPSYMPAYFRIGQLAAKSKSNFAHGEEAIRRYLEYRPAEDEPGLGDAWYWLGVIQERQGRKAEARQSYENARSLSPFLKEAVAALKRIGP